MGRRSSAQAGAGVGGNGGGVGGRSSLTASVFLGKEEAGFWEGGWGGGAEGLEREEKV